MPYHRGVSLNDVLYSDAYSNEFHLQILMKLASLILRLPKDVFIVNFPQNYLSNDFAYS